MVKPRARVPRRGDVVWLSFDPRAGHEQRGRRPALVLSPLAYNRRVGLALLCPITSRRKGYPFEVSLPPGLPIAGAVLTDQVRSLDWRVRGAAWICAAPPDTIARALATLGALLDPAQE